MEDGRVFQQEGELLPVYDAVHRRLIDALARTGQTIPMDIARRINRTARSLLTDAEQPLSRGELLEWAGCTTGRPTG